MSKKEKLLPSILKAILSILLFGCLIDWPYSYYEFVRFISFVGFGYLAILELQKENTNGLVIYASLALLFQPFFKIVLGRELWNIIDIVVGIGLIVSVFYNVKANIQDD